MTMFPSLQLSSQLSCSSLSRICRERSYIGHSKKKWWKSSIPLPHSHTPDSTLEASLVSMSLQSTVIQKQPNIAEGATMIGRKHKLLSNEGEKVVSRPCYLGSIPSLLPGWLALLGDQFLARLSCKLSRCWDVVSIFCGSLSLAIH